MFASPARRLLIPTLIVVCAFLTACGTPPEPSTTPGPGQPAASPVAANTPPPNTSAAPLPGVPVPANLATGKQTKGEVYEGFLDNVDCDSIWGWAWNKNQPNTILQVEILSDGAPIATIPASQLRKDVATYAGDNGYHGYVLTVPASLKDGKQHVIRARIAKTDAELQLSSRPLKCTP